MEHLVIPSPMIRYLAACAVIWPSPPIRTLCEPRGIVSGSQRLVVSYSLVQSPDPGAAPANRAIED